jgi:hypothetical protein
MIEIQSNINDDKTFVGFVEQILNVGVNLNQPEDIFIIKVDHWFDFKWRQFSHKIFGALGVWHDPLRVPPFVPDRIVEEVYFEKTGQNYKRKEISPLHFYQPSAENAQRKINDKSAVFIWFSGDTVNNSQASLMVYTFKEDFQNSWYVSFIKKTDWQIYKTDNISRAEIKAMLENDYLALIR